MNNTKFQSFKFLLMVSISILLANTSGVGAFQSKVEQPEFTRIIQKGSENVFQVALVRYGPRTGEANYHVDLVGAVHIGEQYYYKDLNQKFKQYDAVLYEAIKPKDASIPMGGYTEKTGLSAVQAGLADYLGLTFQMDQVDYTGKQFLHADLTPLEFKQSMDAKGETLFSMFFKIWRAGLAQGLSGQGSPIGNLDVLNALMSADRQGAMRKLMATVLLDMEALNALEGSEGSTIISARNDKALQVLNQAMVDKSNQSIAIFYGAGHLPDLHDKLLSKYDLVPLSTEWLDVWTFQ